MSTSPVLKSMRDHLEALTKQAEQHPNANTVASLAEIVKHARSAHADLDNGFRRIAKGELSESDASDLADRLVYDAVAAVDLVAGAIEVMNGEG
jgi:hypothetical protein